MNRAPGTPPRPGARPASARAATSRSPGRSGLPGPRIPPAGPAHASAAGFFLGAPAQLVPGVGRALQRILDRALADHRRLEGRAVHLVPFAEPGRDHVLLL